MVSTGQEMFREKSGNFKCFESGKISSLKGVREKGSFRSTLCILFPLLLLFSNILNSFVHFTDMNHVVLVGYCTLDWTTSYVKELCKGKFYIWQEKVREFQNPLALATMLISENDKHCR